MDSACFSLARYASRTWAHSSRHRFSAHPTPRLLTVWMVAAIRQCRRGSFPGVFSRMPWSKWGSVPSVTNYSRNCPTPAYTVTMKTWTLCAAILLAASSTAHATTLFDQLGGEAKLRPAVDELVNIMLDDDRINFVFAETDLPKFKGLLYDQLCQLSGGPCQYKGRDMFAAHQKLKVKNAQFNALTEDLYRAMDRVGIAYRVQNKLVAKLAPMQREIVK